MVAGRVVMAGRVVVGAGRVVVGAGRVVVGAGRAVVYAVVAAGRGVVLMGTVGAGPQPGPTGRQLAPTQLGSTWHWLTAGKVGNVGKVTGRAVVGAGRAVVGAGRVVVGAGRDVVITSCPGKLNGG